MLYRVYDGIAWCYSQGWGKDYHHQARPAFEDHVFPRLAPGARVLDLCCGSGDLSALLAGRGYRVTGIDGSQEMLRYARERVPAAEFQLGDARSFDFDAAFDAVLSTFDSLNHVLSLAELAAVFANVHRALAAGGLFLFDLNMQEAFETLWGGHCATVDQAHVSLTRAHYDAATKLGRAEVTLFRREGPELWRRSDLEVLERCYSAQEIACALARSGFIDVAEQAACGLGMRGEIALGRSFFFASKP